MTQRNVYFGKNPRDQAAERVLRQLEEQGIDLHEVVKEMLLQIANGVLEIQTEPTLRIIPTTDADLRGMVSEVLGLLRSGQAYLTTNATTPNNRNAQPIQVDQAIIDAFDAMDD